MQLTVLCKGHSYHGLLTKTLRVMKLTAFILLVCCLHVTARGVSQNVTFSGSNVSLKRVFSVIKEQTGFLVFVNAQLLKSSKPVTLAAKDLPLNQFLDIVLKDQDLDYSIKENTIVISRKSLTQDLDPGPPPFDKSPPPPIDIKGKITNAEGESLEEATILVKGTNKGTKSDVNGNFSISLEPNSILIISHIGFEAIEIKIGNQTNISIQLKPSIASGEQIVVVGYGTQRKVNLTGSISTVSGDELANRPITQASQALAGLVTGVTVTQGSGRPGNDASIIQIRGMGTFSGAGNEPLVLVDGLASSINDVDYNNIESISVLKDAASASIYGTRAANGVILIKTKRGQKGKLQVSYNNLIGWQKVTKLPQFLESWEYATLRNEASANSGTADAYTEDEIAKFKSGSDPDNYPNTPHLKNLLNSGSGFQTNHNLSFMGGDEKNSFLLSLSYLHQDGIVAENSYNKYNFLLNFDSKIKDNLFLKVNLSGFDANTEEPRHFNGDVTDMIGFAVREPSTYAGRKSDGTYGHQDQFSPEAWMDSETFGKNKNKMFLGGVELAWEMFKGLTISGKAGYNYSSNQYKNFQSTVTFDPTSSIGPASLAVGNGDGSLVTLQSLLQYAKKLNRHSFNVLAGFSQEAYRENYLSAARENFPNNLLWELNAGAQSNMQNGGSGGEWALRSYFGRLNYSFNEKYLFEANARYDGTSRFPKDNRWGLFPSLSVGWRISKEPFIENNFTWIDNLKLRASWGKLGNQNIGNYPYQSFVSLGRDYLFGGSIASGAATTTLANKNIKWESTQITDIGLDLSVFKSKLSMVVDYFDKTTSGILYNIFVSSTLGMTPSEVNAGGVRNTGIEVLLNYQTSIGDVHIGLIPNFSYTKNRVTELGSGLKQDINTGFFVGKSLQSIYGYVADGLFADANDVANYAMQPYSAEPGFVRYKDISGPNGKPDGQVDDAYDRTVIGTTLPKYSYGATITANFKGFDFSLLLHGLGGFEKQMLSYEGYAFYNGGQIQRWQADNRWTTAKPNTNATYPKLTNLGEGDGTLFTSTFWQRNASFLRAKNLQIGYTIPKNITSKLKMYNLHIFLSGQNLFTRDHFYKGWDPEMSQSADFAAQFYPLTSVYTFGVNVRF